MKGCALRTALLCLCLLSVGDRTGAQPTDSEAWYAVRTPQTVMYTNAPPERSRDIALALERFRAVFARLAPAIELKSPAPTKILAFRDAEAYAPYKTTADSGGARILGQFLSHPDGNYLTLDTGTQLAGSFAVIYHEYVHYFARHNFPGLPLWLNEGLAEYYSTFESDGERVVLGLPVERHVRWLQRQDDFALDDLLALTTRSKDYHRGENAGQIYALSWALAHYLLSGETERLDHTADFLLRLDAGDEPTEAFESAFDLRLSTLEDELRDYVRRGEFASAVLPVGDLPSAGDVTLHRLRPGDALYHLGDLLAHQGRGEAAERHFLQALAEEPEHAEAHGGLALVRDLHGRFDEAEVLFRDALRLGSQDPLTYLLYGRHLLHLQTLAGGPSFVEVVGEEFSEPPEPGDEAPDGPSRARAWAERARLALERALELDPDYAEAGALLGLAHLRGAGEPADGVRALERTHELLPTRMDVVANLAQLEARIGHFERAEAWIEEVLAVRGPAELVAETRAQVRRLQLLATALEALNRGEIEEGLMAFDEAISETTDPQARESMERQLEQLRERLTAPGGVP